MKPEEIITHLGSQNKGFWYPRTKHPSSFAEKAFIKNWQAENKRYHILSHLFKTQNNTTEAVYTSPILKVSRRDRFVVATVIQWLGTNVGMGFLHKAIKEAGYEIAHKPRPEHHKIVTKPETQ